MNCSRQRCRRPASSLGLCRTHLTDRADELFRDLVRSRGYCEAGDFDGIACNGVLQTMHLVSRTYRSVRWDLRNAAAGCAAHHTYLTNFPLAHLRFCEAYLGAEEFRDLRLRAEAAVGAPDYESIIAALEEAAA